MLARDISWEDVQDVRFSSVREESYRVLEESINAIGCASLKEVVRSREDTYSLVLSLHGCKRSKKRKRDIDTLIARDGKMCAWCGRKLDVGDRKTTVDHVIPKAAKGSNEVSNYLLACKACNSERGCTAADEWLESCLRTGRRVNTPVVLASLRRVGLAS